MTSAVRPGSKALISEINDSLVLDLLRRSGQASRPEITRRLGLGAPTVSGITARLMEAGLVRSADVLPSTGGRPAHSLTLVPEGAHAVGVQLSSDHVYSVLLDLLGRIVAARRDAVDGPDPEAMASTVVQVVNRLSEGAQGGQLAGVGIALPGGIDRARGRVELSEQLGWRDVDLGAALADRLSAPITMDSLVHSFAASMLFDQPAPIDSGLVVSAGRNLGMAMILDGRLYRGAHSRASGFGHMRAAEDHKGVPCHCGDRGCLDAVASLWGIEQQLAADGGATGANDTRRDAVFSHAGFALGVAVRDVVRLFDPERVVIAYAAELDQGDYLENVRDAYFTSRRTPERSSLEFVRSTDEAWARGAGCEALSRLFRVAAATP